MQKGELQAPQKLYKKWVLKPTAIHYLAFAVFVVKKK
jgi:hypothetical protein